MEVEDMISLIIGVVGILATVFVAIGGAWVVVKVLLATHNEKIDRVEKDIVEIKEERKEIHTDMKAMLALMNKMYSKVGVLDERTKNAK